MLCFLLEQCMIMYNLHVLEMLANNTSATKDIQISTSPHSTIGIENWFY